MRELSLHILDILQNSIEAGARHLELGIDESTSANKLIICIQDDGKGMDEQTVARVVDPFFTTRKTRQVGLGIALLKAAAERCNGSLQINSEPGKGTTVVAGFQLDHIDRAPLGDIRSTILGVVLANQKVELHFRHTVDGRCLELDTAEIRSILGDVPLSEPKIRRWLEDYLDQEYRELYAS
ncbi:MAG: ATP-binding protein [Anaerolineae bacterium]